MKVRYFLFLILLLVAIFALSCGPMSRVIHVEISCDTFEKTPASLRNDFEIYVGDKIYVELCSNPSTGFAWKYTTRGDIALKEVEHGYQAPNSDVSGAPGKQTWIFEGVSEGNTGIIMNYSQPWDGGIKDKWIYQISAVVTTQKLLPTAPPENR
jgi:predicted secreted protein